MTQIGLPVPPGFVITTEANIEYLEAGEKFPPALMNEVHEFMEALENKTDKGFGDPQKPLLVSVRSGSALSMPGMMDTILNLGLNDETAQGLIALTKNERFVQDAYRRFLQLTRRGHSVLWAPDWSAGYICAVARNDNQVLEAGVDPRGNKSLAFPAMALAW